MVALAGFVPALGGFGAARSHGHDVPRLRGASLAVARREALVRLAARRRWLGSAAARSQRAASKMAFHGLSAVAAEAVAMRDFGSALAAADANPATSVGTTGRLVRYVGDYRALIRVGRKLELEDSSIPLRVADGGVKRPVDLRLRETPTGFAAANPLHRVVVARRLSGGVSVGPHAIRIVPQGTDVSGRLSGGNSVFFGDVGPDEDVAVTPTVSGAEVFTVLRSRLSPELLRYRVALPHGAVLRSMVGGAAISLDGRELAYIPSPSVIDAQMQAVPARMTVSRDEVRLRVFHRGRDVAYPLLVDPALVEPSKFQGWTFHSASGMQGPRPAALEAPSGEYPDGSSGEWVWTRPDLDTRIVDVNFYDISWSATGEAEWELGLGSGAGEETPSWYWLHAAWEGSGHQAAVEPGGVGDYSISPLKVEMSAEPRGKCDCANGSGSFSVGAIDVLLELPGLGGKRRMVTTLANEEGESTEETLGGENAGAPGLTNQCYNGHPINCATGNQVETQTDLAIGGRGPHLAVTRTYNSALAVEQTERDEHGSFGYGWSGPYSDYLTTTESTATVHQANGSTVVFTYLPAREEWIAAPWVDATFYKSRGGSSEYTLPNETKLEFNGHGQLTGETTRNRNSLEISRNSEGQIDAVYSAGRKLTFAYNAEGEVESVEDPMGHTVKYSYEDGNLVSVTEPGESTPRWRFKYNSEHELTAETDGRGYTVTTEYNSDHQAVSQTDAMHRTREWKYASPEDNQETTITEPNGSRTVEKFNPVGLPTSVTRAAGTSLAATTTYEYNGAYELISSTDPNHDTTTYTGDDDGDRTSETNPDGDETKWEYDAAHDVVGVTTPDGEKTTIERDSHGNVLKVSRAAPGGATQVTKYKYDSYGDVEIMTDPRGHEWKYEYDGYGDRTGEVDPQGDKRTWGYNEDSQETSTVSPRGHEKGAIEANFTTEIKRNEQGWPERIINPVKDETKYTYDADGDIETITDPEGSKTTYTYNADDEPEKVEEPKSTIETAYNSEGQVTAETDGNKHTTKYERNLLGEVTEEINPLGQKTTKEYDEVGNLTSVTDAEHRTTTYKYDPANRLTEITYSDGKTPTVKYEYNGDGDRTKMIDGSGESTYTYDQLDRLEETK
ncbi:MAG TPA: DUF6531 domain-containing protein, partial [Solirubrobacteraceae bacterium]|nr:DUF6531 domain-containing protein [Solirubrobacteraceae bacterium]